VIGRAAGAIEGRCLSKDTEEFVGAGAGVAHEVDLVNAYHCVPGIEDSDPVVIRATRGAVSDVLDVVAGNHDSALILRLNRAHAKAIAARRATEQVSSNLVAHIQGSSGCA